MVEIEKLTSTFVDILLAFTGTLAMQKKQSQKQISYKLFDDIFNKQFLWVSQKKSPNMVQSK